MRKHYDIDGHDFSIAGEASSDFKRFLKKLGISPDIIRRVAIAMYEAEINTIIHGGGGICDTEILKDKIIITFKDNGPGIKDINLAMQEGYSTATEQIRELGFGAGMGLPNIKKYTDDMEIETEPGKGTTVRLIINV
ncbi:MAG: ATP-binding protein [Clostridiales bacterium]|nr:ATP-binding protein [Clostridiales bacterium]